jgi:formylglycine-generating enzyme required for sulfatase activity
MDFGLVKAMESSESLTSAGTVLGSPEYMAPEQADPDRKSEIGPASDCYALGVVAYEMLTGRVPFDADSPLVVLRGHAEKKPPDPRDIRKDLPKDVAQVLLQTLSKSPRDRHPTAIAMVEALRQAKPEPKTALKGFPVQGLMIAGLLALLLMMGVVLLRPMLSREITPPPTDTQSLAVLNTKTPAPAATATPPPMSAIPPSKTPTPTDTYASTSRPTATATLIPTATHTPTSTPSATVAPSETPTPTSTHTLTSTPTPYVVVTGEVVNVREGPGTVYDILGQVKQGDRLPLLARTASGDWWQVDYDGQHAWIAAFAVEVDHETVQVAVAPTIPPTPTPIRPAAGATQTWEKDDSVMVYVPAGKFWMGSDEAEVEQLVRETGSGRFKSELPRHQVELDTFWMDRTEVTNEQYAAFLNKQGNQSEGGVTWLDLEDTDCLIERVGGKYQPKDNYADHPVIEVSWYGAIAYCAWADKRLPTEAEWEKAASWDPRARRKWRYPWGDESDPNQCNSIEKGPGWTTPVGQYSPDGDSPYGLTDMAGNVWEWTSSLHEPYPYDKEDGRENPAAAGERVIRGGSWSDDQKRVRAADRGDSEPFFASDDVGFRCARSDSSP